MSAQALHVEVCVRSCNLSCVHDCQDFNCKNRRQGPFSWYLMDIIIHDQCHGFSLR